MAYRKIEEIPLSSLAKESYIYESLVLKFTKTMVDLLAKHGLNRVGFAKLLSVSPAYITKLLNGSNLTLRQMVKISVTLNCDLNVQMKENESTDWTEHLKTIQHAQFEIAKTGDTPEIEAANTHDYALAA